MVTQLLDAYRQVAPVGRLFFSPLEGFLFVQWREVSFCEGFRTTAHRDSGAGTGAVVPKRPGKEPAGR
jgi:hypothetical protein